MSILLLLTTSCQIEKISQTELKLERYAATTKDFPKGWAFVSEDWGGESGKESYSANYNVPSKNIIGFGETIVLYPDQARSQNAYLEWEKEWFSVGEKWPGTEFAPLDSNDEYRYECTQISLDKSVISCVFLQKHNELVVLILVNIDDKAMTFSQLNEVLRVLDERLNKVKLD
jgi:hypothetical protein